MTEKVLAESEPPLQHIPQDEGTRLAYSRDEQPVDSKSAENFLEQKLLRKVDARVLPILCCLFLISFVDRSNLANARIEGLEKSLHMNPKGHGYNIALFSFTIPYILFEVPSNIILKKVQPTIWLSGIMFCWGLYLVLIGDVIVSLEFGQLIRRFIGICTMGQGLTKTFGGLVVCRALMGFFESGFVPGCAYLIGSYYKRHEFQFRYSIFFSAAVLAGAFSGFLAYLLAKMDGIGGYEGWRWIFIIEGLLTVIAASVAFWVIAPWPEDANFLTTDEKALLLKRLALDRGNAKVEILNVRAFKNALADWKIWIGMFAYLGADNTASSIVSFQPTILKQLGYTSSQAQVHSIPVYMVAVVFSITAAYFSDRLSHRYSFCMAGMIITAVGWGIELGQAGTAGVRYFGLYCCASGVYIMMPCLVVWLMNNLGVGYKRAIGTAFQIGGGNAGNLISSNIFISTQAPRYPVGFGVGFALNILAGVCCTILYFGLSKENRRRDRGERDYRLALPPDEVENLGDHHPMFRYTL